MCACFARALRSWVSVSHWSSSARVQVRCGSTSRSTRLTCGRVRAGAFSPPVLLHRQQEGAGEQGQGDVMVPAGPTTHLVLIQARLSFGGLELRLNGMIANDKCCVTRWGALALSWWRRPKSLRPRQRSGERCADHGGA